jgi:hypothetical protein
MVGAIPMIINGDQSLSSLILLRLLQGLKPGLDAL